MGQAILPHVNVTCVARSTRGNPPAPALVCLAFHRLSALRDAPRCVFAGFRPGALRSGSWIGATPVVCHLALFHMAQYALQRKRLCHGSMRIHFAGRLLGRNFLLCVDRPAKDEYSVFAALCSAQDDAGYMTAMKAVNGPTDRSAWPLWAKMSPQPPPKRPG